MIPAYNKKRCAAVPFETGIHFRRKTDFFPEEDTTKSYSGFKPEPTRLQAEGHSHHTGWATLYSIKMMWFLREEFNDGYASLLLFSLSPLWLRGSLADVFNFQLHPASGEERFPRSVKNCRDDPRRDHVII
ncbi:poly polymerase [Trichonephila clavipes]|nr:poly polymerase [Trichonephila clavipes]